MTCSQCGSPTTCNCQSFLNQDPALCCPPAQSSCCQNVVTPASTPFYNCAPACPESHVQKIITQSFRADVKIVDSWNVPDCDLSAVVNTESLHAIVVGSYLWNPTYGYFLITTFNSGTGQLTLLNTCVTGNAAAGTQIPACTEFTVTVPPCDCTVNNQDCVAIDFTAPDNGNCTDITLTNTTGIQVAYIIQIGSGQYRVSAVKANDVTTICNDGDGITPGTSVIAKDAQGNYNYCIQIIASNPCLTDAVDEGTVLVCGENSQQFPLQGGAEGWVLTIIDQDLKTAAYRPAGVTDCTTTTSTVNIIGGTDTYNIPVVDSSLFVADDIVLIDNLNNVQFTVSIVPDATHITVVMDPAPVLPGTIPSGSIVCLAGCCETLQTQIDTLIVEIADAHSNIYSEVSSAVTPGTITDGMDAIGNTILVTIPNPSPTHTMSVFATIDWIWTGDYAPNEVGDSNLFFRAFLDATSGAIGGAPVPTPVQLYFDETYPSGFGGPATYPMNNSYSATTAFFVAVGQELKIAAYGVVGIATPDDIGYNYATIQAKIHAIIVAV